MAGEITVNQFAHIELGEGRRLENPREAPLVFIEVRCGDDPGEDDIMRYDNVYRRNQGR